MQKIKILHTADLHLCSPLSALGDIAPVRQAELLDAFGRIVDLAKAENVDVLLISGDLFDNPKPSQTAAGYVCKRLAEIPGIKVFIALGNHDAGLDLTFPDNVCVFGGSFERVAFEGFDVYGVSFEREYYESNIIGGFTPDDPSKINILVLHGDLVASGGASRYNPVTAEALSQTACDYIALGHVHAFSGVRTINNTRFAYPGTPEPRGFDETGARGVILGEVYKHHADLKFVPVSKREFLEVSIDVSDCGDYIAICDKITGSCVGADNLFKINLTGETDSGIFIDLPLIYERIKDQYFYVKLNDFTRPKLNIDALSQEFSLKGLFVKKLLEQGGSNDALKIGLAAISGEKVILP